VHYKISERFALHLHVQSFDFLEPVLLGMKFTLTVPNWTFAEAPLGHDADDCSLDVDTKDLTCNIAVMPKKDQDKKAAAWSVLLPVGFDEDQEFSYSYSMIEWDGSYEAVEDYDMQEKAEALNDDPSSVQVRERYLPGSFISESSGGPPILLSVSYANVPIAGSDLYVYGYSLHFADSDGNEETLKMHSESEETTVLIQSNTVSFFNVSWLSNDGDSLLQVNDQTITDNNPSFEENDG